MSFTDDENCFVLEGWMTQIIWQRIPNRRDCDIESVKLHLRHKQRKSQKDNHKRHKRKKTQM